MTVMDRLRTARASARDAASAPASGGSWTRPALGGAAAAALSAVVVVLPALVAWVATAQSTVTWTEALGLGASLWLLGGGAHLRADAAVISLVPLFLPALSVVIGVVGTRRALREAGCRGPKVRGLTPYASVVTVVAWTGGYAVCATLWGLVSLAGPARPTLSSLALPVLLVPSIGSVLGLRLYLREEPEAFDDGLRKRLDALPRAVTRASRPAALGVAVMLACGAVLVAAMVVAKFGQVTHLQSELDPGFIGSTVLAVAQFAVLPNFALWAVSFCSGAGFSVVDDAATTWTGSESGLMPMVPVLGALPPPGAFPGLTVAVVLLPLAVGGLIAWLCLRSLARLSPLRAKASAVGAAVVLAAFALGALDLVGGGSIGAGRLSHIGAPALFMTLDLLAEFAVGAAVVLVWDYWRVRR